MPEPRQRASIPRRGSFFFVARGIDRTEEKIADLSKRGPDRSMLADCQGWWKFSMQSADDQNSKRFRFL